jgi:uncharacterized lipoprotein YmbA
VIEPRRASVRRLTSLAGAALLLLAATGACFRGSIPPREFYRLQLPDSLIASRVTEPPSATAPLPGSLAVDAYRAPGLYGRSGIVYRLNGTEYNSYPQRDWAIPLSDQLGLMTQLVLRHAPLTRDGALFEPPNERSHTWLWRGTVREFEEVDRADGTVLAAVRLEASLIRAADDSVAWSGMVRLERPVDGKRSMNAVVETLSAIALEAVATLVAEARAHVSTAQAASAGNSPR